MSIHKLKEINKIPLKEAENNQERRLLGLLDMEANDIQYGRVEVDLTISGGKIVNVSITKVKKNLKF